MALFRVALAAALVAGTGAIYLDNHWDLATKLTDDVRAL
jgi:hypothetical protein